MRFLLKPNGYAVHNVGDRQVSPPVFNDRTGEMVTPEVREAITVRASGTPCEVDDKQETPMVPRDGMLYLSPAGYESLRKKFGAQLICEPIGGETGEAAAKKIAALETRVVELEAQLAAKKPAAK